MSSKFTVACIGCGSIAQHLHLPGYAGRDDVSRIVVADPVAERRDEVQEKFPIAAAYTDYRDLFAKEKPDFVSVCSPNRYHAEHALATLEAGAHLLLEKPMTMTMAEAYAVRDAAGKAGSKVMIGFSHRLYGSNLQVKEVIESGEIGEPFMIRARFAHGGPFPGWAKSDWFYDPQIAGGGALFDMGIHAIDLCHWLVGMSTSVSAETATLRKPIALDDNALLTMKLGPCALGYIEVGWTSGPGFLGVEIYGDDGSIINDYSGPVRICTGLSSPDHNVGNVSTWRELTPRKMPGAWEYEIDYFMDTVLSESDFPINIDAGINALAVALAAMESAKTGQRQEIAHWLATPGVSA